MRASDNLIKEVSKLSLMSLPRQLNERLTRITNYETSQNAFDVDYLSPSTLTQGKFPFGQQIIASEIKN